MASMATAAAAIDGGAVGPGDDDRDGPSTGTSQS